MKRKTEDTMSLIVASAEDRVGCDFCATSTRNSPITCWHAGAVRKSSTVARHGKSGPFVEKSKGCVPKATPAVDSVNRWVIVCFSFVLCILARFSRLLTRGIYSSVLYGIDEKRDGRVRTNKSNQLLFLYTHSFKSLSLHLSHILAHFELLPSVQKLAKVRARRFFLRRAESNGIFGVRVRIIFPVRVKLPIVRIRF